MILLEYMVMDFNINLGSCSICIMYSSGIVIVFLGYLQNNMNLS